MIAALYVETGGVYFGRPDVDPWDEARDARRYAGPWPVVAHPPCGPWGHLRHLAVLQEDHRGCGLAAVEAVRRWGGVLEHPAHSTLWEACGLPAPGCLPDAYGGVSVVVDQCDFGHVARKRTWLYLVGVRDLGRMPPPGRPTHWVSGSHQPRVKPRGRRRSDFVPDGVKICSARQRNRTPPAFADFLVALAHRVRLPAVTIASVGATP